MIPEKTNTRGLPTSGVLYPLERNTNVSATVAERPRPIDVSDSLRILIANSFAPDELRHLAAIRDAERPGSIARRSLSNRSAEELADMIVGGRRPTIGWWRRHSKAAS